MQGLPVHSPQLKVLVVAEDPLVRAALCAGLEVGSGHRVVGQAASTEASARAEQEEADAVLWDLGLDAAVGLERLNHLGPGHRPVVALVGPGVDPAGAVAAGASGVVERDAGPEVIRAALAAVAAGLAVFDRAFVATLVQPRAGELEPDPAEAPLAEPLTAREREVLGLVVEGLSNKEIGARLGISEHTAKFHVNAILGKLGAQKRVEAVIRAARLGIVEL